MSLTPLNQFNENDLKVIATMVGEKNASLESLSEKLKMSSSTIESSLNLLTKLNWVKKIDDMHYEVDMIELFDSSLDGLNKCYKQVNEEEKEFLKETSTSLKESMSAANNHLSSSMNLLFKDVSTLGLKLQDDLDMQINKYETNRLRAFGHYRINLDSFIRSEKERIIHQLKSKLGMSPNGDLSTGDFKTPPKLPSALYIAETINNSRDLIKRGFQEIDNKTKATYSKKKNEVKTSANKLLSNLKKEINENLEKTDQLFTTEKNLFLNKIRAFEGDLKHYVETIHLYLENSISNLNEDIRKKFLDLQMKLDTALSEKRRQEHDLLTQHLSGVQVYIETINEDFQDLIDNIVQNQISSITYLFNPKLVQTINELNELLNYYKKKNNQDNRFSNIVEKKLEKSDELIKKLKKTIKKVEKTHINFEENKYEQIKQDIIRLEIELNHIKENQKIYKQNNNDFAKDTNDISVRLKKKINALENIEVQINTYLSKVVVNGLETILESIYTTMGSKIRRINLTISELHKEYQQKLDDIREKTKREFSDSLTTNKYEIKDYLGDHKKEFSNKIDTFSETIKRTRLGFEESFSLLLKETLDFYTNHQATVANTITRILNEFEVNQNQSYFELKQIYEDLSISLTSLINTLENKLGKEYEVLLNYFEETKETNSGTIKVLFDELAALIPHKIDQIWTTVLTQLNSVQGKTDSSSLNRRIKNSTRETTAKVEKSIQSQLKGIDTAMDMLQNSIKLAFDDVETHMNITKKKLETEINEYQKISRNIIE